MDTIDPKPGYLTTEFWITVGTVAVTAVVALGTLFGKSLAKDHLLAIVPAVAPLAAAIASAVYAMTRAKTKQAHLQAITAMNVPAPAVVSHGTVNVQPVIAASGDLEESL